MKVLLGLSGGVDSAVSAKLLLQQGYEVTGCYLDNGLPGAEAAREAAEALGIPFVLCDMRKELEENVCAPFAEGYLRGETPIPCILCNRSVKFPLLLKEADACGADYIATGHYAVCRDGKLFAGKPSNDQSYMLCRLKKEMLPRLLLPLGEYEKTEVRAIAAGFGLKCADKPDSMEICFIPDKDYASWIERRGLTPPPGDFVYHGKTVGTHKGIHHYTIGQGRRLGIALGKKVYVSAIDPKKNTVTLANDEDVWTDEMKVRDINWLCDVTFPVNCSVRIRHSRKESPAAWVHEDGTVKFLSPVRAPTAGQAAAFYSGEQLLGGGFIK